MTKGENNFHPKSDENPNETTRNEVYSVERDACCNLCCYTNDDCYSFCCFLLGFLFAPIWCCFFVNNRKSKKFERRFFAYMSCIGCSIVMFSVMISGIIAFIIFGSYGYFLSQGYNGDLASFGNDVKYLADLYFNH